MVEEDFVEKILYEIGKHKPWEEDGSIWKNEADYTNWLRSQFRSIWSDFPLKNAYLKAREIQIPKLVDGKPTYYKTGKRKGQMVTLKGYKCELTGKVIKASKPKGQRHAPYNIDHIDPAGSCTTVKEALIYFLRLLTSPDNMQLIDTEVHKIISHYDKWKDKKGFTCFNDASADKKTIQYCKSKKDQVDFLESKGISPASNADDRRQQIYDYLRNNLSELDYVLDYK